MRALSVKPGLVVDPVPGNVVWIHGFWHVEACIEELFEAGLVELELGIARVIQAEYGVANVAGKRGKQVEGAGVAARVDADLGLIQDIGMKGSAEQ